MFASFPFLGGGGGGPVVPLPGGFADADVPDYAAATAGWRFNSDGTVDRRTDTGWTLAVHLWHSPLQAGIGNGYQLRATVVGGSTPDTGTYGAWLSLSASRTFTDTVVASQNLCELLIEISTDGSDATVVTDGDYHIDVLSEP